jgi:CheY-like chemotaxis protein
MADPHNRPVIVVGDNVSHRWDVAWALHEAGIPAEQAASADQARHRASHGRLAGLVVEGTAAGLDLDELLLDLRPDPETGEIPFVLAFPGATDPAAVVHRVRCVLQASWSSEPR